MPASAATRPLAAELEAAITDLWGRLQRHTDPRYVEIFQKPGAPPPSRVGIMTAEERGQHTSRAVLYAFDAETGEELFSSKDAIDDWTHLSSITVVDGSVYVTTRQSFVYAFGLKK